MLHRSRAATVKTPWHHAIMSSAVVVASGDVTMVLPAQTRQGDLLVGCIAYRSNATFTVPSGWTLIDQQSSGDTQVENATGISSCVMAYITHGATAPSTTFTRTGGDLAIGRILTYRGHDTLNPLVGFSSITEGASSTTATATELVTDKSNCLVVVCASGARGTAVTFTGLSARDPSAATATTTGASVRPLNRWQFRQSGASDTGANGSAQFADGIKASPGGTGSIVATWNTASRNSMIVAAFRPKYG